MGDRVKGVSLEGRIPEKVLILGAAGRDFHNFNVYFRDNPGYLVVGFTAAQIPGIEGRSYPKELCGDLYPGGLPIWPEEDLEEVVKEEDVDRCVLAYSDLSHQKAMNIASRVLATGADFCIMGPDKTALRSNKPVVAVCAVRTGAGKSQVARYAVEVLRGQGLNPVVVRHPMPYGDLAGETVQRFASFEDLDEAGVTIEEREEYEAHLERGTVVYAGVDYQRVLDRAEEDGDVVVWDGGNNDLPFFWPDLWITVADPLRPGHELSYHPGEANFRAADVVVINKADSAPPPAVEAIRANAALANPAARVILVASRICVEDPEVIRGKRVLVIEDGPTITHGGMAYGAGKVAALRCGAAALVDPRPFSVGSIAEVYARYGHIGKVLPAVGYYPGQVEDLEETVRRADCDCVVVATPVDLRRLVDLDKPSTYVTYELAEMESPGLRGVLEEFAAGLEGGQE